MDPVAAKFLGAGLACIGMGAAAIGVANVFGQFLIGAMRNPSAAGAQRPQGRRLRDDRPAQALRDGHTFYSENAGLPSLRRELAAQYRRLHDVELDPASEIVVTASGLQALHRTINQAWPFSTTV